MMKASRSTLLVFVLFAGLAGLHTWPLASAPGRTLVDRAETLLHLWAVNNTARQLTTDPLHPFDGNSFYPFSNTAAVLDHVFANALLAVPVRVVTTNPVLVYNIVLLSTFTLSGFFTCLLVRRLTGSLSAGLVSGCAFAFCTVRWNHIAHLHVLSAQWVPLALLMLHRFLDRPSWKRLAAFVSAAAAVALSSWHIALVGGTGLGIVALWTLMVDGRPVRRRIGMLCAAGSIIAVLLIPFYTTYRSMLRTGATAD